MIEQLFGSKTRVKLLQLFYSNPNRSFYVREITRKIDEQINSVRRELGNLLSIGIISSDTTENRLYYEVNQKYEFFKPLSMIFGEGKGTITEDADIPTKKEDTSEVRGLGNVQLALYTGSFTRDEAPGVDLLIVGDVNATKLAKFIETLEKQEGREIRFAAMPIEEWEYRSQVNDRFYSMIVEAKKMVLVDKKGIFTEQTANKEEE